jgi:NAD+ kinase
MRVLLFPHTRRDPDGGMLRRAADALRALGAEPVLAGDGMPGDVAFAVCLGGDGAVLRAAHACAPLGLPILSVNLGGTGFLTELEPEELPLLERVVAGAYERDRRAMLDVTPETGASETVLNDVVFSGGTEMVELSFFTGGEPLTRFSGSGAIVATPTGSTAFSLSAGGPLAEPRSSCMLLTPVCPHTLYMRPIVLPADSVLTARISKVPGKSAVVAAFDGERLRELPPGCGVDIRRSALVTDLIRVKKGSFYTRVNERLAKAAYGGKNH